MAIPDNQKVDYLWKKIGYAAAKTDTEANKQGPNESIPSPLIIRGDKIMANSASIPTVIPVSNAGVVTVYTTSLPIELTNDPTSSTNRTWLTNLTDWISPEFGSTYQAKVYISPSSQSSNVATKGTQVFATGSGNNDEWFFDYQAGVLNFIGNNLPSVSFTGNSVYVSAARYTGQFGYPNVNLGDFLFQGNTITSIQANGNILINAPGTGTVQFIGSDAIGLPYGDGSARPINPIVGYTRFNTESSTIEYYDGTNWISPGQSTVSSEIINPDGVANTYPLSANTTSSGILVSINGTIQQPIYSYNIINNNQIQFTETPLTSDVVEVRLMAPSAVTVGGLKFGTYTEVTLDTQSVNIVGNIQTTGFYNNLANTLIPNVAVTTVDSYSITSYRTAKYIIQAVRASDVESYETLVTHNGSTAVSTTYGVLTIGNSLGNVSATIVGSNVQIQFTPSLANIYLTVSRNFYPI
jgi:hypothetical protein